MRLRRGAAGQGELLLNRVGATASRTIAANADTALHQLMGLTPDTGADVLHAWEGFARAEVEETLATELVESALDRLVGPEQ